MFFDIDSLLEAELEVKVKEENNFIPTVLHSYSREYQASTDI